MPFSSLNSPFLSESHEEIAGKAKLSRRRSHLCVLLPIFPSLLTAVAMQFFCGPGKALKNHGVMWPLSSRILLLYFNSRSLWTEVGNSLLILATWAFCHVSLRPRIKQNYLQNHFFTKILTVNRPMKNRNIVFIKKT